MLTESLVLSQPPPSMGFSRPIKRRRLTPSSTPTVSSPAKDAVVKPAAPLTTSCVSCHRALKATHGLLVICARCSSATCAICSRTCTAYPSSMPPTPYLTRSPTPNPSSPSPSPKRPALSLNSANTNRGEKRRKNSEEDSQEGFLQTLSEFDLAPGCGRTVCRNCCTENKESASAACYDCMGRD